MGYQEKIHHMTSPYNFNLKIDHIIIINFKNIDCT